MFSVPKVWNSTRISHFKDLDPPMSKYLRSDILGVNWCFLSLHADTGPEFIISTIWSPNPLQMLKKKTFWRFGATNHLQSWKYDISDILEPQSMFFVPKCRNWTTICRFGDFKPQSTRIVQRFGASINVFYPELPKLDENMSFRKFGASIISE